MKFKDFSKLYFAFVLFKLATAYRPDDILVHISASLFLISLLIYFVYRTGEVMEPTKWLVTGTLLCAIASKSFLVNSSDTFFILAVVTGAFRHLLYIIFFYMRRAGSFSIPLFLSNLFLVAILIVSLNNFVDIPDNMFYAINIYGIILGFNLIIAMQFNYSNGIKNYWVPVGVSLFIVSDLILAASKFSGIENQYLDLIVVFTYGLAQYLVILGILLYFKIDLDFDESTDAINKDQHQI